MIQTEFSRVSAKAVAYCVLGSLPAHSPLCLHPSVERSTVRIFVLSVELSEGRAQEYLRKLMKLGGTEE